MKLVLRDFEGYFFIGLVTDLKIQIKCQLVSLNIELLKLLMFPVPDDKK